MKSNRDGVGTVPGLASLKIKCANTLQITKPTQMYNYYTHNAPARGRIVKLLIIMKLSFLLLIIPFIHASASSFAQGITLSIQNAPLKEVFKELRKQTNYTFIYSTTQISNAKKVNISVKDAQITEVLDQCFKDQPFTYTIRNKIISIKPKFPTSADKQLLQSINIKGIVVDENNRPLSGAIVIIKNTTHRTTTNEKGEFIFTGIDDNAILSVSYVGYQKQETSVKPDMGTIKLLPVSNDLNEVEINAGYYTVKEREKTGSISRITAKDIARQPVSNFLQTMQGRLAGVEITQFTGAPGGGFNVKIRGRNSIANGNDPLYIINGAPITLVPSSMSASITPGSNPLSAINPSDVESIEVLKDADATAIYGSRGANGVVLITTKKGSAGQLQFNADFSQGIGTVGRKLELLNGEQYLEMRKEAFANDKTTPRPSDYDVNGIWSENNYTDWQKELIGGTANSTNGRLSLTGGSLTTTFLLSGNYYRETTVFPGDNSYNKIATLLSINHTSPNGNLNLQASISYNNEDSTLPQTDLASSILLPTNAPKPLNESRLLNWENGTFTQNPYRILFQKYTAKAGTLFSNSRISYAVLPGLEISTRLSFTKFQKDELSVIPLVSYNPALGATSANRRSTYGDSSNETFNIEPQVSWTVTKEANTLNLIAGVTIQNNNLNSQIINGSGYTSDDLMENIAAASSLSIGESIAADYRYTSIFGRLNYSLTDKYYLNLTGRRDGSSRFGPENIFANFGAVGAAWIFGSEKFATDNLRFLSFGKLRASYGIAGNDQIGDYNYLELWNPTNSPYQGGAGLYPLRLQNPNYAWETNKKAEVALELGFLKDKLRLSSAYYRNRSSNQLVRYNLAPSTGYLNILANLPATVQNTGWEFEASSDNLTSGTLKWITSFNISIPKNKLISFPNLAKSSYGNTYVIDEPLNILKSWSSIGVNPETGLYTFVDYDNNGTVTFPNDNKNISFVGQKYSGGIQNQFTYKGWELSFLFQYVNQTGRNYRSQIGTAPGTMSNQPIDVLRRWRNPGDVTDVQKYTILSATAIYGNARSNADFTVSDASFARLKNISLYYQFEKTQVKKLGLNAAKIYLQAQNLLTITSYKGLDPENQNFNALPSLRMVTAGLQVAF
jgi:TonB-linked SusC/RagA family outer membrane protein